MSWHLRALAPALIGLCASACSHVGQAGSDAALASVMAADRAFAKAAADTGLGPAFLAWFDSQDSQFISPGAVMRGAQAIAAGFGSGPSTFKIVWAPDDGAAASSGDFATTTGRYTVTSGGQEIERGRYLSVWRKTAAGEWKVLTQTTTPDPPPLVAK